MGKILVVGSGLSGLSAVRLLIQVQKTPVLFDSNEKLDPEEIRKKLQIKKEVEIYTGNLPDDVAAQIEMLVLSPGVPIDCEFVNRFRHAGVKISGEIELAYTYDRGRLLAVTGTNGKTTTTALLGAVMQDYFKQVFIVGNIGKPYTEAVLNSTKGSVTVAEISSFQLETIRYFHPCVSAILNISPDHLNRHHTLQQYILEKEKIAVNQTKDDTVVLNYEDDVTRKFGNITTARPLYFSSKRVLEDGFYLKDGMLCMKRDEKEQELLAVGDLQIIGMHNYENAMAAIAMAFSFGVPMESIVASVKRFKAVAHRIEFVAEKDGVVYYNDSKGTNVDAAIKGIRAMTRTTCLIGGGYDKGAAYDEWIEAFDGKVKKLVLLGATAKMIAESAQSHGFTDYVFAKDLEEAVMICKDTAESGEAVLLSPACASWGMFDNYEQRGDMFKELVRKL
ncbi:MAG TPA: UDP-N-acetylmuramoyl-L-alanine--D-glutamate ligase [Lachnospiraceae bacterium]|nr:UDP-N-acetylmuramoyl-L-alanine--D-glutamate ligase [Lachnospiraceae bacterium]